MCTACDDLFVSYLIYITHYDHASTRSAIFNEAIAASSLILLERRGHDLDIAKALTYNHP